MRPSVRGVFRLACMCSSVCARVRFGAQASVRICACMCGCVNVCAVMLARVLSMCVCPRAHAESAEPALLMRRPGYGGGPYGTHVRVRVLCGLGHVSLVRRAHATLLRRVACGSAGRFRIRRRPVRRIAGRVPWCRRVRIRGARACRRACVLIPHSACVCACLCVPVQVSSRVRVYQCVYVRACVRVNARACAAIATRSYHSCMCSGAVTCARG